MQAGAKTPGEIALVAITGVLESLRDRMEGRLQAARTEPGTAPAEVKFINPVCGVAVSTDNALHVEKYGGVSYYFCCNGCRTTFLKDPGKYAAIHHASMAARK